MPNISANDKSRQACALKEREALGQGVPGHEVRKVFKRFERSRAVEPLDVLSAGRFERVYRKNLEL